MWGWGRVKAAMLYGKLTNTVHFLPPPHTYLSDSDTCDIPVTLFSFRYIILHVIDESHYHGNESLGQVIIDLDTFDPEKGSHQIHRLSDLVSNFIDLFDLTTHLTHLKINYIMVIKNIFMQKTTRTKTQ